MTKYKLSPQARKSLKQIKEYSTENFGTSQTKLYLQALQAKMRSLAKDPSSGKERDEIKAGYYSGLAGSHVIFYRINDSHIDILDVLHQSMEPTLHL